MNPFAYLPKLGRRSLAVPLSCCLVSIAFAAPLLAALSATPFPAPLLEQSVLNGLIGKRRVIGFTERGGVRFLGGVLYGDHGLYVVQTFHYVSVPAAVTQTTPQRAYVVGRNGRGRTERRQVKTQFTTQKTIADETAVRALLSGVAGAAFIPCEQPAQRELVAPADVTCLQELLPPATAAAPKTASAGWTLKTLWAAPDLTHS